MESARPVVECSIITAFGQLAWKRCRVIASILSAVFLLTLLGNVPAYSRLVLGISEALAHFIHDSTGRCHNFDRGWLPATGKIWCEICLRSLRCDREVAQWFFEKSNCFSTLTSPPVVYAAHSRLPRAAATTKNWKRRAKMIQRRNKRHSPLSVTCAQWLGKTMWYRRRKVRS